MSGIYFNAKYRIKRNAAYEEHMRFMRDDIKLFSDYASMLMVSAIIGFNNHTYVPNFKPASDGVQTQFFSPKSIDIIDLIAYSHENKQSILSSDEKYKIFEGYANGGFPILIDKLGIDFTDPIKNDRLVLFEKYFGLLLTNGFLINDGTNN